MRQVRRDGRRKETPMLLSVRVRAGRCGALLLPSSLTRLASPGQHHSGQRTTGLLVRRVEGRRGRAVVAGRVTATATSGENGQSRVGAPAGSIPSFACVTKGLRTTSRPSPGRRRAHPRRDDADWHRLRHAGRDRFAHARKPRDVTSSVTVATADDMHAVGANQLSEVLRFVPGFASRATGVRAASSRCFPRAASRITTSC